MNTGDTFSAHDNREAFFNLLQALERLPPPPCTTCPFFRRCASNELACEEFYYYVERRTDMPDFVQDRLPSRLLYLRINANVDSLYPRRKLTAKEIEAIKVSTRTAWDEALWNRCSVHQVRAIRQLNDAATCELDSVA